jgi:uncharacterized hydrophobic protein (TIGR00271 family)
VRRAESQRTRLVQRLWGLAFLGLPTLSVGQRAEVYGQMRHAARASVDFYVLIVISTLIATLGLYQNSAAVIIGAMLVAPLMSPIVAIAQGIVQANFTMVQRAVASTAKGTTVAVAVAAGFALAVPDLGPTPQILARTAPTLLDLGVGLAAGAAAAYAVSRASVAAALPGVAIAVALVPPLGVVGYGLGTNRLGVAIGSFLLFLTNLGGIVFVAVVIFMLLGFKPRAAAHQDRVRTGVVATAVFLVLLSIPLGFASHETTVVQRVETVVETAFRKAARGRDLVLRRVKVERVEDVFVVQATVYSDDPVTAQELGLVDAEVERDAGVAVRLETIVLRAEFHNTPGKEE